MPSVPELPLDLGNLLGLTGQEARQRLEQQRALLAIVVEVIREPMFIMLVVAGSLYLLLGDPNEAIMLLGFVLVVMGITIVQSRRTERALDALRDLSSPRAVVIRDGAHRRIAGREVG